jgi:hypothetical protein
MVFNRTVMEIARISGAVALLARPPSGPCADPAQTLYPGRWLAPA